MAVQTDPDIKQDSISKTARRKKGEAWLKWWSAWLASVRHLVQNPVPSKKKKKKKKRKIF
jgi:hypothetical protein